MTKRRTAILFGGSAYNIKFSLPSQLENLIIPNDADVFIVTTRFCKRRITVASEIPDASENDKWNEKNRDTIFDETPLSDQEIQLIKDTFGDRVKCLHIVEEMPEYMDYLNSERLKMGNMVNWYVDESVHMKIPPPFGGGKFNHPLDPRANGTIRCVIDQYRHVKKCYEFMEQYENENGFKYDWVMRARIDFIVPEVININHYAQNHDQPYLYVAGSHRRESWEWLDEFFWFSKRSTAAKLYPELNRMGLIHDRKKYQTLQYGTDYAPTGNDFMFDPECQFSMLLHEINLTQLIHIPIYRSACYTNGGDSFDYFNYRFRRDRINLDLEYQLVCSCETDINEHLPTLRKYAEQCDHVTEFGIRFGNSSVAFFSARPKKFVSYDVFKEEKVDYLELIAKEAEVNWELKIMNPSPEDATESMIEETDLLFIDTNHFAQQMAHELKLHASKVRKYIILHDVFVFWTRGAGDDHLEDGLKNAVEPFLASHPEWQVVYRTDANNGLMVMERVGKFEPYSIGIDMVIKNITEDPTIQFSDENSNIAFGGYIKGEDIKATYRHRPNDG